MAAAQTFANIIDRIFLNLGGAAAGQNRDVLFADLIDLVRSDLPRAGGHAFAKGTVGLTLGVTGSVAADGKYAFPATLRSFGAVLQVIDAAGMGTGSFTYVDPQQVYTDADAFYSIYRFGAAQGDSDYGKPFAFLIEGQSVTARPIPNQAAVATPWWGTLALSGTVHVDADSLSEASLVPFRQYEPALVAHGTWMEAVRQGRDDVIALYAPIAKLRTDDIADVSLTATRAQQGGSDF